MAAQSTNRAVVIVAVVAALLLAVVGVVGVVVVQKSRADVIAGVATAATDGSGTTPAGVTATGAVRVGDPNAKVVVRVVADLQCPACKQFEKINAKVLEDAAENGTAIEYDVISFLDRASSTQYSSRAANASYCVAGQDHSKYQGWFAAMFEQQPAEGGKGLPDGKLIEIAKSAGYTDPSVAQCITDRTYDTYLRDKTEQVLNGDVNATPTVFVNGKKLDSSQMSNGLGAAIAAAR